MRKDSWFATLLRNERQKDTWRAKLLRTLGAFFPVSPQRQGHCVNCGACCHIPNSCPFVRESSDGKQYCGAYRFRPLNCRKYPRIEDEWIVREKCGFYFDPSQDNEKHSGDPAISS